MRKILSAVGGMGVLLAASAGVAGADSAEDADVVVVIQQDPSGDVQLNQKGAKTQKAPRRIRQSVDIKRVRYRVDHTTATPSLVITTEVRDVLKPAHPRTQRFWTQVDNYNYYFTYIRSDAAGQVKVQYFDRGGAVSVPCPEATVRLWPGPKNERVVQTIPLSCIRLDNARVAFSSRATVVPKGPHWFIAADRTPRTTEIDLPPWEAPDAG